MDFQKIPFVFIKHEVYLIRGPSFQLIEIQLYGWDGLSIGSPGYSCELILNFVNLKEKYIFVLFIPSEVLKVVQNSHIKVLLDDGSEHFQLIPL